MAERGERLRKVIEAAAARCALALNELGREDSEGCVVLENILGAQIARVGANRLLPRQPPGWLHRPQYRTHHPAAQGPSSLAGIPFQLLVGCLSS